MIDLLDQNAQTILDGGIDGSVLTLDILAVAGSPSAAPFRIWIDDEIMIVTDVTGDTYAVVRGVEGSAASAHADGADVFYPLTSGVGVQLAVDIARMGSSGGGIPGAHASSHEDGGTDEIDVGGLSGLLADGQTPLAHKTSHQSGGSDAIKLDDLAAPDDNTDLNVSTGAHGLAPKLPNDSTKFLNGVGSYAVPPGTGSGITELTGDINAGPGSGSQAATLPNIVTGATKTKVSYNAKGQVTAGADANLASSDFANQGTVTTVLHGNAAGNPAFGAVVEGDITLADVTTLDASTAKHGLMKKLPNDATKYYDGSGAFTVPTGTGAARGTVAVTTASLAVLATESGSLAVGKSSIVYKIVVDQDCRVRLYSTSAGRDADVSRDPDDVPASSSGLLLDVVANSSLHTFLMQPAALVYNMDGTVATTIYYNITNLAGSATTITATFTRLLLEN